MHLDDFSQIITYGGGNQRTPECPVISVCRPDRQPAVTAQIPGRNGQPDVPAPDRDDRPE